MMVTAVEILVDRFRGRISRGEWPVGRRLPTERALSADEGFGRSTVRQALAVLEADGMIKARQGSGRVVEARPTRDRLHLGLLARGGEFGSGVQNARMLAACEQTASNLKAHLTVLAIDPEDPTRVCDEATGEPFDLGVLDGAVLYAPHHDPVDFMSRYRWIKVVALSRDYRMFGIASYFLDFGLHAALAATELTRLGHRRIALAYASSERHRQIGHEMQRGVELGLRLAGIEEPAVVLRAGLDPSGGDWVAERLAAEFPEVTALISYGSCAAVSVLSGDSPMAGFRSGEMATVCLTDARHAAARKAGLAYFHSPLDRMASDAIQALCSMVRTKPTDNVPLGRPYGGSIVRRESLRPPPSKHSPEETMNSAVAARTDVRAPQNRRRE